jgi:outer membrane protein TolC
LLEAAQTAATVRAAEAGTQAAEALRKQAWASAWMPRLDASASTSQQKQTYNGSDSSTPASVVQFAATLPLWRAADRATVQAQQALAEQAFWQARGQKAAVARDLSLAYVAAAEAAEQGRLAQAQLALLESQLVVNDKRLRAGIGTVLDQLETRTRVDQVRASIRELAMRARTQQLTIERLSGFNGMNGQSGVRIPAGLSPLQPALPDTLPTLDDALLLATHANPQLQDARAEVDAAKATTRARDAEFWQPTVDATATTSRTRQTQRFEGLSEHQNITTRAYGVQLNWPLFTGGYQQGRTQEATALLSRSQARQDDAQSVVRGGLLDAYQSLAQAQAMADAQRDVEHSAVSTSEAVNKAFLAGTRSNLDLLNAQQQIYSARQSLASARLTALTAHIQILALLDQLDAAHVAPLMAQFDARAYPASPVSSPSAPATLTRPAP